MSCWPFSCSKESQSTFEALEMETKMADHVVFAKRVRKSLYYGEYSDASLPSLSVTDVAVEVLNNAVPCHKRILDSKYAHSVARRAKISPCVLMMGMLYAERLRLRDCQGGKTLSSSDIFLISIMVASKYLYDEGEDEEVYNEDWAKASFKSVKDINKLERDFLKMMDWNLFISKEEFSNFVSQVEARVATTKGLSRGWLTYHDMSVVLGNPNLLKILLNFQRQLLKIISSCMAAYIVGVSILLGSSSLATINNHTNMTTAQSTFNCLTTDSECLFSRHLIDMPSDESEYQPISARRVRTNQRFPVEQLTRPDERSNNTTAPTANSSTTTAYKTSADKTSADVVLRNNNDQRPVKELFDYQPLVNVTNIFGKLSFMAADSIVNGNTWSIPLIQSSRTFPCLFPSNKSSIYKSLSHNSQGLCYGS